MRFEKISYEQFAKDIIEDVMNGKTREDCQSEDLRSLYDRLALPSRATKKSAGYDIHAPYGFTLTPGDTIRISTGIRVLLDDDKFLMCAPRSGHGFKARIQLDNTIGIIDADYSDSKNEGHIMLKLTNDSNQGKTITVNEGDGMAQAIILPYFVTEDDAADGIRDGGFGSTDNK